MLLAAVGPEDETVFVSMAKLVKRDALEEQQILAYVQPILAHPGRNGVRGEVAAFHVEAESDHVSVSAWLPGKL